jgi:hypothetical protein
MTELSPPTTDPSHSEPGHSTWQSGDVFRAVLFALVGAAYALLLLPLAVMFAALGCVSWLIERGSARSKLP